MKCALKRKFSDDTHSNKLRSLLNLACGHAEGPAARAATQDNRAGTAGVQVDLSGIRMGCPVPRQATHANLALIRQTLQGSAPEDEESEDGESEDGESEDGDDVLYLPEEQDAVDEQEQDDEDWCTVQSNEVNAAAWARGHLHGDLDGGLSAEDAEVAGMDGVSAADRR